MALDPTMEWRLDTAASIARIEAMLLHANQALALLTETMRAVGDARREADHKIAALETTVDDYGDRLDRIEGLPWRAVRSTLHGIGALLVAALAAVVAHSQGLLDHWPFGRQH